MKTPEDYHPNLDGPAEPIGLAMAADEARAARELAASRGSARRERMRETLRLFDKFLDAAPDQNIANELNGYLVIYRSELQARDSVAAAQNRK